MSPGRRTFSAARVIERREVARDTVVVQYAVDLEGPVLPGQFAMVHPGDDDRYVLPRPLSILRYSEGRMDLLIKVVGRGSHELAAMQPGEELRVFAPLGRPFDPGEFMNRPSVLVAGGVGIVPLHLLSSELRSCGEAPRPIFGARTPDDLPRELLGEEPAGPWQVWVESGARAGLRKGLVTDGLLEALEDTPDAIVATCGPTPMMHAVARICRERDVELRVCLEEQMGCGSGVCRACVIDDARDGRRRTVCQEGPVFDVRSIVFLPEDRPGPAAGGATS